MLLLVALLLRCSHLVHGQVTFQEIAIQSGIDHVHRNPMYFGGGIAVIDFDNDGWEDVYVTGGENSDKLFRNLGNGQFADVSVIAGIGALPAVQSVGAIAGDVDNDGFQDILITTFFNAKTMLLHNQGDGTFAHIPNAINDDMDWKTAASFGDVNKDGLLDVYLTAYVFNGVLIYNANNEAIGFDHDCNPNQLFINNGNLTFTNVTATYGVADEGCALGVAFTDYDNDQDVDILLANDFGEWVLPSALFQNQYPITDLADVSVATNMNAELYGMGVAIGDYDHDGDLDYYQTGIGRNLLSRNDGFVFSDMTTEANVENDSILGVNTTSWGCFFFDADNDGWHDLFVANGEIPAAAFIANAPKDPNKLYLNNGDETFSDASFIAGVEDSVRSRGAVYADFDRDGKLDFMVSNVHDTQDPIRFRYYRNTTVNNNHWVEFKLEGVLSNRDAFGSHVTLWTDGSPTLAEVDGGSSHVSKNSSIVHFGMGDNLTVDSVRVIFPSGIQTTLYDLQVDQRYTVLENTPVGLVAATHDVFNMTLVGQELRITSSNAGQFHLDMVDLTGRSVWQASRSVAKGVSLHRLPENLSIGLYILRADNGERSSKLKLYVQ